MAKNLHISFKTKLITFLIIIGMINCIDHLNVIEVPNFQREDVHDGEMDKKEKPNKTSEEDDFDCRECKQKIRKTLFSSLPPQLLKGKSYLNFLLYSGQFFNFSQT